MKEKLKYSLIVFGLVLFLPVFFLIAGFSVPPQYGETYYAELSEMCNRLAQTKGKKIILLGNSSIAFGSDSALIERQLKSDLEYTVCNFGLYGAIGTKTMLDLSISYVHEGDIVVFSPELNEQALSLYFSAPEVWKSVDSDWGLLRSIDNAKYGELAGNYIPYVSDKFRYFMKQELPKPTGVYAKSSFDERCDMRYERKNNILLGGYDKNNLVSFQSTLWQSGFMDYVNAYCDKVGKKGGEVVYEFCPVNGSALRKDTTKETILDYFYFLSHNLKMPIIGNPENYIFEKEWFYDSNFHMNDSGSKLYSMQLASDLKSYLCDSTPSEEITIEKPSLSEEEASDGDNSALDCFTYLNTEDGLVISGLTEKGRLQTSLMIPYQKDGVRIVAFSADVFRGNERIEEIIIQRNIRVLYDQSFDGCLALRNIRLQQENVGKLSVGMGLLSGTNGVILSIPQGTMADYLNDYFWGHYAGKYQEVEEW